VSKKRVLVTGGAGFLGVHLCERLIARGDSVLCLDSFYTSTRSGIAHLLDAPNFELIEQDVSVPLDVDVDEIFNLACPASPVHYQKDPVHTVRTNVSGAINMLELARKTGAKILQASTSEVYGDPNVHPQLESYWGNVNPIGPRSCYDEGKRCAETLFYDYHRQYGVNIRVMRIFNTYGPGMLAGDGRVVSNFITQALENKPLTIFGDGAQTRSFCYRDDLISGMLALMGAGDDVMMPINIGNPQECTMRTLAQTVIRMTNARSKITYSPLPQDDPVRRCPDIEQAKKLLNRQPQIGLEDGLAHTIAYFKGLNG
jgi:UDP-glucuronate decarboxylase